MAGRFSTLAAVLVLATFATLATGAERTGSRAAGQKTSAGERASPDFNLDGVWRGFVVEGKGERPDRGPVHLELTIKGNHISARRLDGQGAPLGEGAYTLTTDRFYLMDATEIRRRGKARPYQGIVSFGPDLMKWCVATPGNTRPADFETKRQQFLVILKRQGSRQPE